MLKDASKKAKSALQKTIQKTTLKMNVNEVNTVISFSAGTAEVSGLSKAGINELLLFPKGVIGLVHTLNRSSAGVIFLTDADALKAGDRATRTHRVLDIPVGKELLGRVINPLGQPLDKKGQILTKETLPLEREAPSIMARAPVDTPLQTGIKAIDCFIPIGRGQRELILGDRQTGKTAIAIDTILNQKNTGVICIYCAIGQRMADTAKVISTLDKEGALKNCVVVIASGEDEAGLQYIAPYAATSIGEYFMNQGKDVLVVYDDLTAHARAYRQMSLLLRIPPGREAFPGDIFYLHSRLLERATRMSKKNGGGSLTALPIVATEADNISAYIPTNVISITDGQIYLSNSLYQKGQMPAIDTGRSVSRVGGAAQLPAYRELVGPLKLFYSQFEELESFSKFGVQMDADTSARLKRGTVIRLILQQRQYQLMPAAIQIAVFLAANEGLLDAVREDKILEAQEVIAEMMNNDFAHIISDIENRKKLTDLVREKMLKAFKKALQKKGLISKE
ncbi:MAG: F0F1 ATP synthase subunit alpha [Alphaproteobacteria bacterium]